MLNKLEVSRYFGWEIRSTGDGVSANRFGIWFYAKDYNSLKNRLDQDKIDSDAFYARLAADIKETPTIKAIREEKNSLPL